MNKYSEYKDSGIEWLGQIPEQWRIVRLKYLCNIETGDKDTINAEEEGLYPFFVSYPKVRVKIYTPQPLLV